MKVGEEQEGGWVGLQVGPGQGVAGDLVPGNSRKAQRCGWPAQAQVPGEPSGWTHQSQAVLSHTPAQSLRVGYIHVPSCVCQLLTCHLMSGFWLNPLGIPIFQKRELGHRRFDHSQHIWGPPSVS